MAQPTKDNKALIILSAESIEVTRTALKEIERLGGRVVHVYAPHILIGEIAPEIEPQILALANVARICRQRLQPAEVQAYGPLAVQAVKGWNRRFAASLQAIKAERANEGKSWGAPGYAPEGPVQPPRGLRSPDKAASSAQAQTERPDSSAYLIGQVAVNIILVEGRAAPYTFTQTERDTVVAEIQDGLGWLASAEPRARVSWFYELRQISLDLDPAQVPDFSEDTWRDAAMARLGYAPDWDGLEKFARDRQAALGTAWTFAIFVTRFPLWHFAYAFKPRVVMNYDLDGWGIDDMDRIVAHETAHIFGAADEYAESKCSCTERFGYLQVENGNCELCAANPTPCLMSHNTWALCEYTRGQLGWRDSDGDGILDPLRPVPEPSRPIGLARLVEQWRRLLGILHVKSAPRA